MDNFKIKSIDEFDLAFIENYNKQKNAELSSVSEENAVEELPLNNSTETKSEEINVSFFNNSVADTAPSQTINPAVISEPSDIQPQVYSPVAAPAAVNPAPVNNVNQPVKSKQKPGILVGKIVSIVLLAATIIVFVLGCFVTIFLDNNGSDIFGLCFNTVSVDTYDTSGNLIVSKGDLVISKKSDASEYTANNLIAVRSNYTEEAFSDIHFVNGVISVSGTNAQLSTVNLASPDSGTTTIMSEDSYGIITSYIPALGTLLHFAMDNAILICILFILLAAFWCLLLVLIDNVGNKAKKKKQ